MLKLIATALSMKGIESRLKMRTLGRLLYWLITGLCLGIGLLGILSIGAPFLVAGIILLMYGLVRIGRKGVWAALTGFGALPAFLVLYGDRLYGGQVLKRCPPGWGFMIVPDSTPIECGEVAESSFYLAVVLGAIALLGLMWGLITAVPESNREL